MARVKGALNTRKRHKKILKLAKGFRGAESKQFRIANQAVMRSMQNAYVGRKRRKRDSVVFGLQESLLLVSKTV